jgi:hypothetical protein
MISNLIKTGEVTRTTRAAIPQIARLSQSDPKWWGGQNSLARHAHDALNPQEQKILERAIRGHWNKPQLVDSYNTDCVMSVQDALVPIAHQVEINPMISVAPGSRNTSEDLDLQAFATKVPRDWRKKFFVDYEMSGTLAFNRYCCGTPGVSGREDLNQIVSKSHYYTAATSFCWMDEAECTAAGLFDLIRAKTSNLVRSLNYARLVTAFYGDDEIGLRGIANGNCSRMMLPTPLDQMNFTDAATTLNNLLYSQQVNDAQRPFNRALMPLAFGSLLAERKPDTVNAIAPVEYLADAIRMSWQQIRRWETTSLMQKIGRGANGRKNSPAMLLYNNSPEVVTRLQGTGVLMLPPCARDGMITIQAIINLGDLTFRDPTGAMLVENLLTPSDYN